MSDGGREGGGPLGEQNVVRVDVVVDDVEVVEELDGLCDLSHCLLDFRSRIKVLKCSNAAWQ